jgi:predicted ester cyclase
VNEEMMLRLATQLAEAKSRQNVDDALRVCHSDMLLETPAIGSVVRGTVEYRTALSRFFRAFPDYEVTLERHLTNGETLICWGKAQMTMTGDRFGVTPSGRRAELPVLIEFGFKDDLISSERFHYDLSVLCSQSGVSTDAVRRKLFGNAWENEA